VAAANVVQTFRVAMQDVDVKHIHFLAYLQWADRGVSELLAHVGHATAAMFAEGYAFPSVSIKADFRVPATLDDVVEVTSTFERPGRSSVSVMHRIRRAEDGVLLATVDARHVYLTGRKPAQLPDWLLDTTTAEAAE
jgi:acyl-CoA thioester hydrolase